MPFVGGVACCCHLGPNGEECNEPPAYEVFQPPWTLDSNTHTCEKHLSEMSNLGDQVWRLGSPADFRGSERVV